jgi:hypothetical protein
MTNKIQLRRDTTENWTRINPILDDGEPGLDISANRIKYGDGTTVWQDLPYSNDIPPGGIIMWSGSEANIPLGWALCDGTNSTPNLRDRFIVGAGNIYDTGDTGGSPNAIAVTHSHTASTSITDPGHKHWISGAQPDDHNFSGQGLLTQEYGVWADGGSYSADDPNRNYGRYVKTQSTGISASTSIDSTGSNGTNANLPPYYALCFIMKI